jgi:hypothetical protein
VKVVTMMDYVQANSGERQLNDIQISTTYGLCPIVKWDQLQSERHELFF